MVHRLGHRIATRAERQWMVLGERTLAAQAGGNRRTKKFGKGAKLPPCLGPLHASASVDQRSLRRQDRFCRLAYIDRIGRSAYVTYRGVIQLADIGSPKVSGDLDNAWTAA